MRVTLIALTLMLLVVVSCGMAVLVTGRDDACNAKGGVLHGWAGQECVIP